LPTFYNQNLSPISIYKITPLEKIPLFNLLPLFFIDEVLSSYSTEDLPAALMVMVTKKRFMDMSPWSLL
jgi:hypothetical protein